MANNHTSLATKYRPQSFQDVCGQDTIKQILQYQLDSKTYKQCYLFAGKYGSGKALRMDADILGVDGYFKMRDAKVGMKVWGEDGDLHNIIGVFPQGVKNMYRIDFSDGTHAECCVDHLWNVKEFDVSANSCSEYRTLFAHQIYDLIADGRQLFIPTTAPLKFSNNLSAGVAYEAGLTLYNFEDEFDSYLYDYTDDEGNLERDILFSGVSDRLDFLKGLLSLPADSEMCGTYRVSVPTSLIADSVRFIVQSLGGLCDTYADGHIVFTLPMLSNSGEVIETAGSRKIESITEIPSAECQCIMTDNPTGLFLINDCIVTHNTTSARIFAKTINGGNHDIIEIDAATYNSVDQIRVISDEAKKMPLVGKYKIFIIDECFTGDTEVLTDSGFKRFDELTKNEKIAQYNPDGSIEFVTPLRHIVRHHEGPMVRFYPRKGRACVMTPNHMQPLYYPQSDTIRSSEINNLKLSRNGRLMLSGRAHSGSHKRLSCMDKLVIATILVGHSHSRSISKSTFSWRFRSKNPAKVEYMQKLLEESGVEWHNISKVNGMTGIVYTLPDKIDRHFSPYFSLSCSYSYAQAFIQEIAKWDYSPRGRGHDIFYASDSKEDVDFINAMAVMAEYSCVNTVAVGSGRYAVKLKKQINKPAASCSKELFKYSGLVYCVEVPSHMIVVRSSGVTFVSGNCHSLSLAANNALLKLLEEPPKTAMFILCTTDPQKMLNTVLSRVQRYDFTSIPTDEVISRLKYIADAENIKIDDSSIRYIAKISGGGMRDAISSLDKCSSVSNDITLNEVTQALSVSSYHDYLDLLLALVHKDSKAACKVVVDTYEAGKDMKKFISSFMWSVCDVCNSYVFNSFDYVSIPELPEYVDKIKTVSLDDCLPILEWAKTLNAQIRNESDPKNAILVEVMLLTQAK